MIKIILVIVYFIYCALSLRDIFGSKSKVRNDYIDILIFCLAEAGLIAIIMLYN